MKKQLINEGLDYQDMIGQLEPTVSVDEYAAKTGTDSDVVTLAFIVHSEAVGDDLVNWFERGYDWILDASVSEGELTPGKYLVFVELKRRIATPGRIIELISGLETLTDLTVDDWTVIVDGKEHRPEEDILKELITISPHEYREENEGELNEMRKRAGLETVNLYGKPDREIQAYITMAGL
jgi:hypothetical protein